MPTPQPPSADVVFDTLFAYEQSAALKAALDLDLFSVIEDGASTRLPRPPLRGVRARHPYLVRLPDDAGPAREIRKRLLVAADLGGVPEPAFTDVHGIPARFLLMPGVKTTSTISPTPCGAAAWRRGNTVAPENPIWIEFARAMVPMMVPAAHGIADALGIESAGPARVLDIAASHGIFGITLAQRNPKVEVTAVDWASVLEVAKENAAAQGVGDRIHLMPGDAIEVDFGADYDVALVTD